MGATRRVGTIAVLALLGLASLCTAERPKYRCYDFGEPPFPAKGSHDKSVHQLLRGEFDGCPGPHCTAIRPVGDIIREVGSSYDAYCLFDPEYVNVSEVYFMHWDNDAKFKIDHEVVNNSAIKVSVQHDEMSDYKLQCMMTYKNETKFLCERTVKVGYPPQDVQNLTCVSKNWQELNCSWVKPPNPVRVKYNLTYVVAGFRDTSPCPKNQNGNVNWCHWKEPEFSLRNDWILTFTAQNVLKSGVEFEHRISVYENVIPKSAEKLVAHGEGPHSVKLTWEISYPMNIFPAEVIHEVTYRERPEDSPPESLEWILAGRERFTPDRFEKIVYNKTINGLYAYMQYDFRVRLHTGIGEIRENMWSVPVVTTHRTDSKLPTAKAPTDIGLFEIEQNVKVRDIYVSWQRIDTVYKNGPNFHYDVEVYDDDSGETILKNQKEVEIHDDYAKFFNMENDLKFRFEIRPVNDIGKGGEETKSTVIVPKRNAVLSFPRQFQVIAYNEENSTTYGVKWNITEEKMASEKIESVSIYWCKKKDYEERCMEKIDWINVNPVLPMKNITDLERDNLYNFGISVNSNKSSSGIKWITCIASHGSKLPPIDKFEGIVLSSTEVTLKWNLDCKARSVDPTGFNVSYCIVRQNETDCPKDSDMHYIAVESGSATQKNVSNLRPFTTYIFSIASETELGISRWSKSKRLQTEAGMPTGKPLQVQTTGKGQEWISLSWEPPVLEQRNGIITTYKVTSEPAIKIWWPEANMTSEVTQFNFTGLDPYTKYNFMIVACTENRYCGVIGANYEERTDVGVPGPIDGIHVNDEKLKWNLWDCNGPACFIEIRYGTNETFFSKAGQIAVNLEELGMNCTETSEKFNVEMRAVSEVNEQGHQLEGEWIEETVTCPAPDIAWWLILIIACVCIIVTIFLLVVGSFGRAKVKEFLLDCNRELELPTGLGPGTPPHDDIISDYKMVQNQLMDDCYKTKIPAKNGPFSSPEEQELIPDKARQSRNPSGDSGTSENDQVDSSGCSTGSESDSSSGSHRVPQSSDSGTGTEVGFPPESKNWDTSSLRLRTPVPPYVRPGLPQNITSAGYVSVSSVPNLPVGSMEDGLSLQQSTSSLALGTPSHQPMGARRASTGYISMPDQDSDGVNLPLELLGNVTLPHDSRQGGFPAYSRHNFSHKMPATEMSPYMKTGSLQRLNTGYVAVAQPDGGSRDAMSQAHGYCGDDDMGGMKRQSSLSALPLANNKSISTPDEDLPPGTYCRVGARGSPSPAPGPSPGYVSITQAMPSRVLPHPVTTTSPTKSPYVTFAMAKSMPSPTKEPEKPSGGYVSVGDMAEGRWAHPVMTPEDFEDSREVSSAPIEGTRSRPTLPLRPNTSEATTAQNRGAGRLPSLAPSLSKQSSGYVSQDSLPFHDPVVMSPKRLLTQSKEPYSVIMPPDHKGTAV